MADGKKSDSGTFSIDGQPVSDDAELVRIWEEKPAPNLTAEQQAKRCRLVSAARKDAAVAAAASRKKRLAKQRKITGGRSFEEENWTRLSPAFRKSHNAWRVARDLAPIPEPKVDRYEPRKPAKRPIDPDDAREAIAAARGFLGLGDEDWKGIAKQLALELASIELTGRKRDQVARHKRKQHKEARYRAIAKYFNWWKVDSERGAIDPKKYPDWVRREDAISNIAREFGVKSDTTVETAIREYRKEFDFTDGTKLRLLSPSKNTNRRKKRPKRS